MAVAISVLALQGNNPWIAVGAGVGWGLVPVGLLFGVLNLIAPAWVIRWSERAMVGNVGYRKLLAIGSRDDWASQASDRGKARRHGTASACSASLRPPFGE